VIFISKIFLNLLQNYTNIVKYCGFQETCKKQNFHIEFRYSVIFYALKNTNNLSRKLRIFQSITLTGYLKT